jgi:hypothetical protein
MCDVIVPAKEKDVSRRGRPSSKEEGGRARNPCNSSQMAGMEQIKEDGYVEGCNNTNVVVVHVASCIAIASRASSFC